MQSHVDSKAKIPKSHRRGAETEDDNVDTGLGSYDRRPRVHSRANGALFSTAKLAKRTEATEHKQVDHQAAARERNLIVGNKAD